MRRVVIVVLSEPRWCPPGTDPSGWRLALAEDVVDLVAGLAEVEPAVAVVPADRAVADAVVWPGTRVYELPSLTFHPLLAAAAKDGYDQAVLLAPDAPDLPAMLVGKLLRPLSSRPLALAEATGGGLLGLASVLPAPQWLPDADLDVAADTVAVAGKASRTASWHRLTAPDSLYRLDPGLEGWAATRALLHGV
jgi:hypothetical protein